MTLFRKILFWVVGLFFLIDDVIRRFIDSTFLSGVREYLRDLPLPLKVALLILAIVLVVWTGLPVFKPLSEE